MEKTYKFSWRLRIMLLLFGISLTSIFFLFRKLDVPKIKYFLRYGYVDLNIVTVLQKLDEEITDTDIVHIFRGDLADNSTWKFDFSEISKRRFGRKYSEITSNDPNGHNRDFFNPLNYSGIDMLIFEDYGAGIVERFLLEHRVNLGMRAFVTFEVDGVVLKNTTTMENAPDHNYPFKKPFVRPDRGGLNCGYYLTFPVAYQYSMRISVRMVGRPKLGEKEMWEAFKLCRRSNSPCPLRGYFAITSNKFVQGMKLKTTFGDYYPIKSSSSRIEYLEHVNQAVSKMANAPEKYIPGLGSVCDLTCYNVDPGKEVTIFSADNVAQVIQSLLFRIYDRKDGKYVMSDHWERILVTMTWDGRKPQVNNIPLAGLFTVGIGYLREVNSLMAGMRKKRCSTRGEGMNLSEDETLDWLAYLNYEMPFWTSGRIVVKRPPGFGSAVVCTRINTKKMDIVAYNPLLTGYFSAQLNRYESRAANMKHKTLLRVENEWGHVVAVNLLANFQGGAEELDIIIETENATAPIISGTGFEDYFGYTHNFKRLQNTSSILHGVPYMFRSGQRRFYHVYRHMILDPIIFTKGIRIYIEGCSNRLRHPVRRHFEKSSPFSQTISDMTVFSVCMFYGRKGTGGITSDINDYGTSNSHHNLRYTPNVIDRFEVTAAFENQPSPRSVRKIVSLKVKQRVTHTFRVRENNVGVILRRIYRSMVPNQKAMVEVDGEDAGIWFCAQRATMEANSLRIDDYYIHPRFTVGKVTLDVTFEAITLWESASIEVISMII